METGERSMVGTGKIAVGVCVGILLAAAILGGAAFAYSEHAKSVAEEKRVEDISDALLYINWQLSIDTGEFPDSDVIARDGLSEDWIMHFRCIEDASWHGGQVDRAEFVRSKRDEYMKRAHQRGADKDVLLLGLLKECIAFQSKYDYNY